MPLGRVLKRGGCPCPSFFFFFRGTKTARCRSNLGTQSRHIAMLRSTFRPATDIPIPLSLSLKKRWRSNRSYFGSSIHCLSGGRAGALASLAMRKKVLEDRLKNEPSVMSQPVTLRRRPDTWVKRV